LRSTNFFSSQMPHTRPSTSPDAPPRTAPAAAARPGLHCAGGAGGAGRGGCHCAIHRAARYQAVVGTRRSAATQPVCLLALLPSERDVSERRQAAGHRCRRRRRQPRRRHGLSHPRTQRSHSEVPSPHCGLLDDLLASPE
jgi:hypothetical protein